MKHRRVVAYLVGEHDQVCKNLIWQVMVLLAGGVFSLIILLKRSSGSRKPDRTCPGGVRSSLIPMIYINSSDPSRVPLRTFQYVCVPLFPQRPLGKRPPEALLLQIVQKNGTVPSAASTSSKPCRLPHLLTFILKLNGLRLRLKISGKRLIYRF